MTGEDLEVKRSREGFVWVLRYFKMEKFDHGSLFMGKASKT